MAVNEMTPIQLFRLGNSMSARMDHVRAKDIDMYDIDGEPWVRAGTGGISTSRQPSAVRGIWWRLAAGYNHGPLLIVWNDYDNHWSWEPVDDMPLSDFRAALRLSHMHFVRV